MGMLPFLHFLFVVHLSMKVMEKSWLTNLWGFFPDLIQGSIAFSVSLVGSQNNFVFYLFKRRESGLLYSESGRNLPLLTQFHSKMSVRYITSQGLQSGAGVPSIVLQPSDKNVGFVCLPVSDSGLCFQACVQNQKGLKPTGGAGRGEVKPEILMKLSNISRLGVSIGSRRHSQGTGLRACFPLQSSRTGPLVRAKLNYKCRHYMPGRTSWLWHSFSARTRQ